MKITIKKEIWEVLDLTEREQEIYNEGRSRPTWIFYIIIWLLGIITGVLLLTAFSG